MNGVKLVATTSCQFNSNAPHIDSSLYRSLVGSLQYLALTCPDVAFFVNRLAQHLHAPNAYHFQALKCVLRYLKAIIQPGIHLKHSSSLHLHAYCDADQAGDAIDHHSTTTYVAYIGHSPISQASQKQRSVAKSSTEVEYQTIASTTTEILQIQNFLIKIGLQPPSPPQVFSNNIRATYLCANLVFHSQMKHISIDYHFVRELVICSALKSNSHPLQSPGCRLINQAFTISTSSLPCMQDWCCPSTILRECNGLLSLLVYHHLNTYVLTVEPYLQILSNTCLFVLV